jgi:type II secretory pathway pseudopilin PulG
MSPMRSEAGYTLVELLVAAAVLLMLTAVTCQALLDARAAIDVSAERADLQQRARVALETLTSRIRNAGAGTDRGTAAGSLQKWAPPILPKWSGDPTVASSAVTILETLETVAPAILAFDAPAGTASIDFEYLPGCAAPCGFFSRMTVLVADGLGDFDVFALTEVNGTSALVRRLAIGTGGSYRRGSPALAVDVRTYYWKSDSRELRVFDGDRSDLPVVNDVVNLSFEYALERDDGNLEWLDPAALQDGPWSGTGGDQFDVDLLRLRTVRIALRLQAGNPVHRGADPRWFHNPGVAQQSSQFVKDVMLRTIVTPPNLGTAK